MIHGIVNANREAIVSLPMINSTGQQQVVEATIDTGFNGFLTLPSSLVQSLGFTRLGRGRVILADGSEGVFEIYAALVEWDGHVKQVETDVIDSKPLVGMSLLDGYSLQIKVIVGGDVEIRAITS